MQHNDPDRETSAPRLGFSMPETSILPPALAMVGILKRESLRPHLLVHERVLPEFAGISTEDLNCVVLGDAVDAFSYENMNTAFRYLEQPRGHWAIPSDIKCCCPPDFYSMQVRLYISNGQLFKYIA